MGDWSMATFCSCMQQQDAAGGYTVESESTEAFVSQLGLPSLHPLCESDSSVSWFRDDVPPIGSADLDYYHLHDDSIMEIIKTLWHMIMPPFLAFFALWLLLFAALVAPLGCLLLLKFDQNRVRSETPSAKQLCQPTKAKMTNVASTPIWLSTICSVTIASSFAVMADKLYIHDFGPQYGAGLFMVSSLLSLSICNHHPFKLTRGSILVVGLLAVCISMWDPHRQPASPLTPNFEEGLYYDARNPLMKHIVSNWDPASRIYSPSNGATKWMTTGDVRTGMPFFLNKIDYNPMWKRVWLSTQTSPDEEVLALDIAFPDTGHDFSKPIYLVYHGLNGGSKEGYVQDLVQRRNQEGSTVVVMIARGMMDTPIRSWNFFHGARLSDAHDAAVAIRGALGPEQILVGVGYSMGAIILNNYVATYGSSCALDAAFSISGALDCRYELNDTRSKRLWQPLLADSVKTLSLFGKHGKKVRERLTNYEMVQLMRASSVVEVDKWAAVAYHGFESVEAFYAAMSALGDIPQHDYFKNSSNVHGKIDNVSIPLCVMHALDDPISTWRTVAANEGFMQPSTLVQSGQGNLMLLLTKRGGHVGWPLGVLSHRRQWEFMSTAASDFASAVMKAKVALRNEDTSPQV